MEEIRKNFKDDGCELGDSCLNCTLPRCIYDEPGAKHAEDIRKRNSQIVRLRRRNRVKICELARRYGVSTRTVYRVLARPSRRKETSDE